MIARSNDHGRLAALLLSTCVLAAAPPAFAQANDLCADAIPIFPGVTAFDTTAATTDGVNHPSCKFSPTTKDIWYHYVPAVTGDLTVSLCGNAFDTDLVIYDGLDCGTMTLLDCNNDGCGVQSILTVPAVAGMGVTIRVGGWLNQGGPGQVELTQENLDATLSLEAASCQVDQDPVKAGHQVAFELWRRDPHDLEATGYQAFLAFDPGLMTYEGSCSSYSAGPFTAHLQGIATAAVASGELRLDGNTFATAGATGDALLATLVFTVTECDTVSLAFDPVQPFLSEVSFEGDPFDTMLFDGPPVVADDPPGIVCPADITVAADAGVGDGCVSAVVTWSDPLVTDACGGVTVTCDPPSGTAFPAGETTAVTCTAVDACDNETSCMFNVTVTETNLVCLEVQLVGVTTSPTRCIRFMTDECEAGDDIALTFDGTGLFSGEIELPCGPWSQLCGKDEQHTQWDTVSLSVVGTKYVASGPMMLRAGDTDNDGDVDIHDVTLFLAQNGSAESAGPCPWNGTRGADFSDNGNVAAEDYSLMTPQWLTVSSCSCTSMIVGDPVVVMLGDRLTSVLASELEPWVAARADLNRDRVVDYRDVEIFEQRHGLAKTLSAKMKRSGRIAP